MHQGYILNKHTNMYWTAQGTGCTKDIKNAVLYSREYYERIRSSLSKPEMITFIQQ